MWGEQPAGSFLSRGDVWRGEGHQYYTACTDAAVEMYVVFKEYSSSISIGTEKMCVALGLPKKHQYTILPLLSATLLLLVRTGRTTTRSPLPSLIHMTNAQQNRFEADSSGRRGPISIFVPSFAWKKSTRTRVPIVPTFTNVQKNILSIGTYF